MLDDARRTLARGSVRGVESGHRGRKGAATAPGEPCVAHRAADGPLLSGAGLQIWPTHSVRLISSKGVVERVGLPIVK